MIKDFDILKKKEKRKKKKEKRRLIHSEGASNSLGGNLNNLRFI